ncbi:MAG: carboxypeptidase regulatory-like domain-containing protein [Candidatus Firestonebacteria bacterium]
MRILLFLVVFNSMMSGAFSSLTYYLHFEGDSNGRISEASSSDYYISGEAGAYSGRFFSPSYEINNGWYNTINIDDTPPSAVGSFTSETLLNGNIKLFWESVLDNESFTRGYRIYRSVKQAENGNLLAEIDGTEFTDTSGLIYGITYYYTVRPVDLASNESVIGNIVVSALSKSLSTSVTSLSTVSKPGGGVELGWQAVSGIFYYRIYRSEAFGEKGTQVNIDGNTVAGYFLQSLSEGLTDGKRYYYTAQGVDISANEQQLGNNQAIAVCDAVAPTVPVVSSSTHPDDLPSVDNCPVFSWVEAEDPKAPAGGATGVKGYHFVLSRNSAESFSGSWSFKNGLTAGYDKITDGEWHLFVLAEDFAGNRSAVASKKIIISTSGEIRGRVYDADGKTPLKDTRLELLTGLLVLKSGRTDNDGNYIFTGVPFGAYKLKIYKAGFNPYETEVVTLSKSTACVIFNKSVNSAQNIGADGLASYPNPCKTGTVTFVYKVEVPSKAVIDVYDSAGEKVAALEENQVITGFRETKWEASGMSSGVYFYLVKLENNGNVFKFPVKKLSLIR